MADIRKEVSFSGAVQGVGFRYSARSLARGFAVTGYVKNMADGTVELVAQGPHEEVEGFISALKERMSGYIRGIRERDDEPSGGFEGFEITF